MKRIYQIVYKPGNKIFLRELTKKQAESLKCCFDNMEFREVKEGKQCGS